MAKLFYNPELWGECIFAYWGKAHDNSVELIPENKVHYVPLDEGNKEEFYLEDGTYPEVIEILCKDDLDQQKMSLIEGINLTEFDPNTPGGWGFWSAVFNVENLREVAKNSPDQIAFGEWDVIRQIINMGNIAYVAKVNTCVSMIKNAVQPKDMIEGLIRQFFGDSYWQIANDILSKDEETNARQE